MRSNKQTVSNEDFVRAWQSAETLAEAAKRARVDPRAASLRAFYMRKKGVPLKLFKPSSAPIDIEGLAKIARKAGGQP